jgi:hypothetical protein
MKQIVVLALFILFLVACQNATENKETKAPETKMAAAGMYPTTYSSSFEMGDMSLADKAVLNSWKNWEANKIDDLKDFLADSVTTLGADGMIFVGKKDSLIALWKKVRADYTSIVDSVAAYTAINSTDKNEKWALVWVTEYSTNTKGVKDTADYQETWRFNKDGKADMVLQYQRRKKK